MSKTKEKAYLMEKILGKLYSIEQSSYALESQMDKFYNTTKNKKHDKARMEQKSSDK